VKQCVYWWMCGPRISLLFSPLQEVNADEFEDKEWTFVIEGVSISLLDYSSAHDSLNVFVSKSFVFCHLCKGEQGTSQGAGVGRHQLEALRQSDADADRPDAEAEAAVRQSGGRHAQAVAVLRLRS